MSSALPDGKCATNESGPKERLSLTVSVVIASVATAGTDDAAATPASIELN